MRWIAAVLLVAACGPRAVLATERSTGVRATFVDVEIPGSGSGSGSHSGSGSGSGSGSDTGSGSGSVTGSGTGTGVVWSALPAPHRIATNAGTGASARKTSTDSLRIRSIADARALIGRRDRREPLLVALELAAGLARIERVPVESNVELVSWAQARGAWKSVADVGPGDLLVFDRVVAGKPASLVAVVLARDPRGVIEMMYAAQGVIRRGFVDPTRPKTARDRDRRVVNTYLRHDGTQPPAGTRFLAGELFAGAIAAR